MLYEVITVDLIGETALKDNSKEIEQINSIINEQIEKFQEWKTIRNCQKNIEVIKKLAIEKVTANIDPTLREDEKIEKAIVKTLELVFYSMKEESLTGITENVVNSVSARR